MYERICEECGAAVWILNEHPITKKKVCLGCRADPTKGYVMCPYMLGVGHEDKHCPACNDIGFVEEIPSKP